jgi:hypothetical protein
MPHQAAGVLFQLKSGRTSTPRLPQALQTNRSSDKRRSSGQRSADRDRVRCGSPFSSVIGSSNFRDQDRGADTQQASAFLDCCGSIFGSDFSGLVGQS